MPDETVSDAWQAVNDAVNAAREAVAAAAPDPATAAEGEAYVMRIVSSCLADTCLGHLMTESGLLQVLPTRGGPNPDFRMQVASVDPTQSYRLEGCLNDSERVGVGLYRYSAGGAEIADYAAFDATSADADGRFVLTLGADATGPASLAIEPDARVLIIRTLHRDSSGEPARLRLHGGPTVDDLQLAQGSTAAALTQAARTITGTINTFLEWSEVTSAAQNAFHAETPAMAQSVQGDPDITYAIGSFDLNDGEWLEVELPAGLSGYWSLYTYNHWCESLPDAGIGDNVAVADSDGVIRIAIGPNGEGPLPNAIDTIGRRRGALIFRYLASNKSSDRVRLKTTLHRSP